MSPVSLWITHAVCIMNSAIFVVAYRVTRPGWQVVVRESVVHYLTVTGIMYQQQQLRTAHHRVLDKMSSAAWHLALVVHMSRVFVGLCILNLSAAARAGMGGGGGGLGYDEVVLVSAVTLISAMQFQLLTQERSRRRQGGRVVVSGRAPT
jgi:hypothetical protein